MEGLIERGMDPLEAKAFATDKVMDLRNQAIAHAKAHGFIKCP
ncbi:hypothetical protein [Paenibacillus durus]|nr:hypothetical protein [Paenibacillus durus]